MKWAKGRMGCAAEWSGDGVGVVDVEAGRKMGTTDVRHCSNGKSTELFEHWTTLDKLGMLYFGCSIGRPHSSSLVVLVFRHEI